MTDSLISAARVAQSRAYAPYSKFRVGAALESSEGDVYLGCNVENASYGLTICAERAAVFAAVSAGVTRFRRAVVVTDVDPPAAPCGACRQVIAEFATPETVVWFLRDGKPLSMTMAQLLPAGFAI